jgi:hypothetical protein
VGKGELAELMVSMTRSPRVKLLLSSRPESPFEVGFQVYPSLRLEDLTRTDIVKYVQAKLWDNTFVRSITEAEQNDIDGIASFIIDNASGVFLWVTLIMSITLDGINNRETPLSIRERITQLPVELNELFTHILSKRIAQHHKPEAFRYLLVALSWESSKTEAPLYSVIMAMAEEASTHDLICSVAASDASQISSAVLDFPSRLRSRCQGLLECTNQADQDDPLAPIGQQGSIVKFLHRTLLDYLQQEEGTKSLMASEAGPDFEVYPAMMAGIVCFGTSRGNSLHRSMKDHLTAFFQFNSMAERSMSKHTPELVSMIDRSLKKSKLWTPQGPLTTVNGMTCDWTNLLFKHDSLISCDVLAYTVYTGGSFYLYDYLTKHDRVDPGRLSTLLHYAIPPIAPEISSFMRFNVNCRAAEMLLEHGADPMFCFRGVSSWRNALAWLVWYSIGDSIKSKFVRTSQVLGLMVQMAKHTTDWEMLHRIAVQSADSGNSREITLPLALQECVLEKQCCLGASLLDCSCASARGLKDVALEVLELLKLPVDTASAVTVAVPTPTGTQTLTNVADETTTETARNPKRKIFRKLDFKRLFVRPR